MQHYRGGRSFCSLLESVRALRERQTPAEEFLWNLLRNRRLLGAKFRRQHQIGPYVCDFYCHQARLIVECDGQVHTDSQQQARDALRDRNLTAEGFTVLRFWNDEVVNHTETVLRRIAEQLTRYEPRRDG
jgi:very-short-patch-repair endonuclease